MRLSFTKSTKFYFLSLLFRMHLRRKNPSENSKSISAIQTRKVHRVQTKNETLDNITRHSERNRTFKKFKEGNKPEKG